MEASASTGSQQDRKQFFREGPGDSEGQYAIVPWIRPAQINGKNVRGSNRKEVRNSRRKLLRANPNYLCPHHLTKGLGVTLSDKGNEDKEDGRNSIWGELNPQKHVFPEYINTCLLSQHPNQ